MSSCPRADETTGPVIAAKAGVGSPTKKVSKAVRDKDAKTIEATALPIARDPNHKKRPGKGDSIHFSAGAGEGSPNGRGSAENKDTPKKAKRKAKVDEEAQRVDSTIAKKRKTREGKDPETMAVAARTSVQTLKKAMYIGAHISGAGGKCPHIAYQRLV